MRPRFGFRATLLSAAVLLLSLHAASGVNAASPVADRRQLQIEQQQDALNLGLQQSLRARRYNIGPADARKADSLHLQQRLEQQQLEQQQLQQEDLLRRSAGWLPPAELNRRLALQRELFSNERQLQIQRFDLDNRALTQSMKQRPLQPPIGAGQLELP